MMFWKIRDADGNVIAQRKQEEKPPKPTQYDGEWNPEEVEKSEDAEDGVEEKDQSDDPIDDVL